MRIHTNLNVTDFSQAAHGDAAQAHPLPLGTTRSWCIHCGEVTPVEWDEVDDPDVPECRHCGATDLTPTNR